MNGSYVSLRLQDDPLLLALCDVYLSLRVEQLLAPVSLCFHLQLQLSLKRGSQST